MVQDIKYNILHMSI